MQRQQAPISELSSVPAQAQMQVQHRLAWRGGQACLLFGLLGCSAGSGSSSSVPPATLPDFGAASFSNSASVDNAYFPLVPGRVCAHAGGSGAELEIGIVETLDATKVVQGVTCRIVRDRVFVDTQLIEDTEDWYAQDDNGNVWYMGERVDNYEYDEDGNLIDIDHEGSWEAGLDLDGVGSLAQPGYQMKAAPIPGDVYNQEYYEDVAEDLGEVIALNAPLTLADGSGALCLQIRDSAPLDSSAAEDKYYAAGIGQVLEEEVGGPPLSELKGSFQTGAPALPDFGAASFTNPTQIDHPFATFADDTASTYLVKTAEEIEIIAVEVLDTPKVILGVSCQTVRDRAYQGGLLMEDTFDWYAQDDAGNVWYMGEDSTSYAYDENDMLLGTSSAGSWEAGQDVVATGAIAEPGHLMRAVPAAGDSYDQEFYLGEAQDMATVVRLDADVVLEDGSSFADCLQTLEWSSLAPGALEHKFYASGLGLIREQALHTQEVGERKGSFDTGPGSLPSFSAATFANPTLIDNSYLPLVPFAGFSYAGQSEDGLETILVDVLDTTQLVLGINCVIVQDQAFLGSLLIENTFDWYAQDDAGNVWYMGEDSTNYVYDENGTLTNVNNNGSWEAGQDVAGTGTTAQPGFAMKAAPLPGESYRQEFYPGEALDLALVVAVGVSVELENKDSYANCLQTLEWSPLSPGGLEYKFYSPGIGLVLEQGLSAEERLELQSFSTP